MFRTKVQPEASVLRGVCTAVRCVCVGGGGSDDVSEQQCDGNTRKLKTALVFVAEALMNQTPVLQEE